MAQREKKPAPVPPEKDASVILMLSLMMQMLAFFILLTSMAVITKEKRLAALGSIAGTFGILSGGANISPGHGPFVPARAILRGGKMPVRTARELTKTAKELGLGHAIHVLPLADGSVRVRMDERILFAPGGTALTHQAKMLMKPLANILSRPEIMQVRIEGFTDETPARGSLYPSNWELSAARAMSVLRALLARGVPGPRMSAAGMGSNHPLHGKGSNDSRRVEIIIKFRPVVAGRGRGRTSPGLTPAPRHAVAPSTGR